MYLRTNVPFQYTISGNREQVFLLYYKDFFEQICSDVQFISPPEEVGEFLLHLLKNHHDPLTVGDVVTYVGFSKSYFSAYFKKTLGFSVNAFILRCKLEEGKELLQYTNKSISTISTFLCFSSQSHFQTAFKKQFGMTPNECRRKGT